MKAQHWSQGVFLLGLAAFTASLIPACGGGGRSALGLPQTTSDHKIHVSTTSGAVVVPPSSTNLVIRSITFTPTNPNDVILYFSAEGTKNVASSGGLTDVLDIQLLDAVGNQIGDMNDKLASSVIGTNLPYALRGSIGGASIGAFPSTFYTIKLVMNTSSSWSGQIDSVLFKIVTAENVTIISPSPNIVG